LSVRARCSVALVAAASLALGGCRTPSAEPALQTPEERFSYALGARLGADVQESGHEIDPALVLRGVEDGLAGASAMSEDEIAAALHEGVDRKHAQSDAHREQAAVAAAHAGREFLARNRERKGVVVLPSGLQYEVLREGSGPVPGSEDFVTCHYRGTLIDGTVFDDTGLHGGPRTFQITSVIDGFEEALLRMPAGSRWKLYVPSDLAYGFRGAGARIPPNSALVFEVELISIAGAERTQGVTEYPRPARQP
jgi:FKBP-type peptidyl-prolyl cis-trans isomerase